MKNELTLASISLDEQLTIIGGENTVAKPKPKPKNKNSDNVVVGDGNKVIINIFTFSF